MFAAFSDFTVINCQLHMTKILLHSVVQVDSNSFFVKLKFVKFIIMLRKYIYTEITFDGNIKPLFRKEYSTSIGMLLVACAPFIVFRVPRQRRLFRLKTPSPPRCPTTPFAVDAPI